MFYYLFYAMSNVNSLFTFIINKTVLLLSIDNVAKNMKLNFLK